MHLSITPQQKDGIVSADAIGVWDLDEAVTAVNQIRSLADKSGVNLILVDITKVDGDPTIMERVLAGQEVARILGSVYSLAVVELPTRITKVAQIVANNRGTSMLVTDSTQKALDWLARASRVRN